MAMSCILDLMYKLALNKKYLLAISGGPDSMALATILFEKGYKFEVCHINYLKRASAFKDADIVRNFCLKNNVFFHYKEYEDLKKGNFQDLARVFRYELFSKILKERKLDGIVTAHHMDDFIETYFIQRKRKSDVDFFGIAKETTLYGSKIYRPFLKITKDKLLEFCLKKGVEFGHDESNDSDIYLRNYIRHHELKDLSLKKKKEIVKEINKLNKEKTKENKYYQKLIKKDFISLNDFNALKNKSLFLRFKLYKSLSKKYIEEILRQLNEKDKIKINVRNKIVIKEENALYFLNDVDDYFFVLEDKKYLKTKYFKLFKKGKNIQKFSVDDDDFPLVIRNYKNFDTIEMKFGHKKVNRFLIDRKIPLRHRLFWPVVLNKSGEIIFVYGLGCKIDYFKRKYNFFMLK